MRCGDFLFLAALLGVVAGSSATAELRGHGGPVRALAIAADGRVAISGGFDQSAILWSLENAAALEIVRFHDGAVNAVLALADDRFATGGEDGRIALWQRGRAAPLSVIEGHTAPVAGLAISPDGRLLASASWDETVRVTDLVQDTRRVFAGHRGTVNGVAFSFDGRHVVSAGYDASLRIWPMDQAQTPIVVQLPTPLHGLAVARDGEIVTAGADGQIYIVSLAGQGRDDVAAQTAAITAVAMTGDDRMIAVAGISGAIVLIDRASRQIAATIAGAGTPVWSLAFTPDGRELLAGSGDRLIRRWNTATGTQIGAAAGAPRVDPADDGFEPRGALVFRACSACHTLAPDGGNRAGPTLHGVFGRRIATAAGYNYSDALRRMDIVWSAETIARLFEVGPHSYTPGTKMPEQIIGEAADRAALVRFLAQRTAPR